MAIRQRSILPTGLFRLAAVGCLPRVGEDLELTIAGAKKQIPSQGAVPLEIPRGQKLGVMTFAGRVINRFSQWSRQKYVNKICVFEKKATIILKGFGTRVGCARFLHDP